VPTTPAGGFQIQLQVRLPLYHCEIFQTLQDAFSGQLCCFALYACVNSSGSTLGRRPHCAYKGGGGFTSPSARSTASTRLSSPGEVLSLGCTPIVGQPGTAPDASCTNVDYVRAPLPLVCTSTVVAALLAELKKSKRSTRPDTPPIVARKDFVLVRSVKGSQGTRLPRLPKSTHP